MSNLRNINIRSRRPMAMLPPDPLFVIRKDWTSVMCVTIDTERSKIFCGTVCGMVHISNFETFRQLDKFKNGEESCLSLNLFPNLKDCLLVQDKMGLIRKWSSADGSWKKIKEISVDYVGFCHAQIYEDIIVSPSSQASLKYFSTVHLEETLSYGLGDSKSLGEVMAIIIFERSDKKYVLAALENGTLTIVDFDDGQNPREGLKLEDCPMAIDFDNVSMRGIAGSATCNVTIFSVNSDMAIVLHRVIAFPSEGVASVCIRGDRKLVAVGCWDGRIRLFSWKTFVSLAVLDSHLETINCLTFTSQSPYIMVAGCKEGTLSLWDIYNAKR